MSNPDTSSIGPLWPPLQTSFNRVKGIYTRHIIKDRQELNTIASEVGSLSESAREADRVSVRLIVSNHLLVDRIGSLWEVGEAVMPLFGAGNGLDATSIVYLGRNKESRQPNEAELTRAILNVERAIQVAPRTYGEIITQTVLLGYEINTLSIQERVTNKNLQTQIANLWRQFDWSPQEVITILANPNNIVCIAKFNEHIVSIGIAEQTTITVGSQKISFAEVSEASTQLEHRGQGLYTAVLAQLVLELAHRDMHFAFGECNGDDDGVLRASQSVGRVFAYQVAKVCNLAYPGHLPQHVPIRGTQRVTLYNDLFPSFITRANLHRFARNIRVDNNHFSLAPALCNQ